MKFVEKMINFQVGRSRIEHSVFVRAVTFVIGAVAFVGGIPALVYGIGRLFDKQMMAQNPAVNISIVCFVFGLPWMLWAVGWQLFVGKGTPVPIVPTKKFLENGPYKYVRNPMMLGFFLYLLGWTFLFNNFGALSTAVIIMLLLLAELKAIEEPELEKRFGDAYSEYKKEVSFMLPRWKK